jgi:uncharacterized protein YoxC
VIAFAERPSRLKRQFLELLDKDKEFRLAVAGYLGLSETLKRLDSVEESIKELLEEVKGLRGGQDRLWENQNRSLEEIRALREGQNKLWENVNKLWEEVKALREDQRKLWESINKLWENQNKLWEEVRGLRKDVRDVKTTLERVTLSLEEEARSFIAWRLKEALGVEVALDKVFVDALEINVYGVTGDLCVVGEATVRLGLGLVEELLEKVEVLKCRRPELLRRRMLKVIYTDVATPQALQLAKERGIWILRWDRDLTPMKVEEALSL